MREKMSLPWSKDVVKLVPKRNTIDLSFYKPHKYQLEVHQSGALYKVICAGRQSGKTYCAGAEFFRQWRYLKEVRKIPQVIAWVVAPTHDLTKYLKRRILVPLWRANMIARWVKNVGYYELVTGDIIEFKSADSGRLVGEAVHLLIMDECALISKEIWERDLRPTLFRHNARAIFISTPRGRNWFFDMFMLGKDPKEKYYQSFTWTSWDNPYLPKWRLEDAKQRSDELTYRQEVLAEFLDDGTAFFRKVNSAVYEQLPEEVLHGAKVEFISFVCDHCGHTFKRMVERGVSVVRCPLCNNFILTPQESMPVYYMGVDLAQQYDFTVITVVKYDPLTGLIWVVDMDRFNRIDWSLQLHRIREMYRKYPVCSILIEANNIGSPIVEALSNMGLPVEPFVLTNRLKKDMVTKLAMYFDTGVIRIPKNEALINELKAFEMHRTKAGRLRFSAPKGLHDDCVMSLAFAVWGVVGGLGVSRKEDDLPEDFDTEGLIDSDTGLLKMRDIVTEKGKRSHGAPWNRKKRDLY